MPEDDGLGPEASYWHRSQSPNKDAVTGRLKEPSWEDYKRDEDGKVVSIIPGTPTAQQMSQFLMQVKIPVRRRARP